MDPFNFNLPPITLSAIWVNDKGIPECQNVNLRLWSKDLKNNKSASEILTMRILYLMFRMIRLTCADFSSFKAPSNSSVRCRKLE